MTRSPVRPPRIDAQPSRPSRGIIARVLVWKKPSAFWRKQRTCRRKKRLSQYPSPQNYKFTGKERDTETGLDDFEARYYSSQFGRFHTADWSAIPAAVPYADLGNPQTLNLYAYVVNNPLNLTDPTGHTAIGAVSSSEGMYIVASRTTNPLSTEPSYSTAVGGNDVIWEVVANGEGTGIYFNDKDAGDAFVSSARQLFARISLDAVREEIVNQAKAYAIACLDFGYGT